MRSSANTDSKYVGSVVVVGSVNEDHVAYVDEFPQRGETVLAQSSLVGLGGKGANQAVAASRVSAGVTFICAVGADAAGSRLVSALEDAGVDVSEVRVIEGAKTGSARVTVDKSGDNVIVVDPGANRLLEPSDIRERLSRRIRADVVVVQGEISSLTIEQAALSADWIGARLVLNLAPVVSVSAVVLAQADPLVLNELEAITLLRSIVDGSETALPSSVEETGRRLLEFGVKSLVITLGARGALCGEGGDTWFEPAVPVDEVVDTTGAGDAFVGTLAAALAGGRALRASVSIATFAAASAIASRGAADSYASSASLLERAAALEAFNG